MTAEVLQAAGARLAEIQAQLDDKELRLLELMDLED